MTDVDSIKVVEQILLRVSFSTIQHVAYLPLMNIKSIIELIPKDKNIA